MKNPLNPYFFIFVIVAALILIMIAGAFYWFEYRPEQIKKSCYQEIGSPEAFFDYEEVEYKACLAKHGL